MAYCVYCKARILDTHQKCPNCGSTRFNTDDEARKEEEPKVEYRTVYVEKPVEYHHTVYVEQPVRRSNSERSWIVTLLLCLTFGYLGVHRFYVGKTGSGICFLLTFGWLGIGWLVDFLSILFGGFKDRDGFPVRNS